MSNVHHLGPSVEDNLPPVDPPAKKDKAPARVRAGEALPTPRVKFDVATDGLKVYGVASGFGAKAVSADEVASYLSVSGPTIALNNTFLMASGLLTRESKGKYKPTEVACRFAREYPYDADKAGKILGEPFRKTWFYEAARKKLQAEPAGIPREALSQVLVYAASATKEHSDSIDALIDWMLFSGIIRTDDAGTITMGDETEALTPPTAETETETEVKVEVPVTLPAPDLGPKAEVKVPPPVVPVGPVLLSFDLDFRVTADDLAALSVEQIKALWQAVGEVQAIKAAAEAQRRT